MATECRHRPPCPAPIPNYVCAIRSRLELAVDAGRLSRDEVAAILTKYGVPLSLPAGPTPGRVYKGEPTPRPRQPGLL